MNGSASHHRVYLLHQDELRGGHEKILLTGELSITVSGEFRYSQVWKPWIFKTNCLNVIHSQIYAVWTITGIHCSFGIWQLIYEFKFDVFSNSDDWLIRSAIIYSAWGWMSASWPLPLPSLLVLTCESSCASFACSALLLHLTLLALSQRFLQSHREKWSAQSRPVNKY